MRRLLFLLGLTAAATGTAAEASDGDVTTLAAYNVQADRVEDFGFRVTAHLGNLAGSTHAFAIAVLPNTAAAKAGLRPGDRILKSDGKPAAMTLFSLGRWPKWEAQKWAQVAAGKTNVSWELEVQSPGEKATHVVKMAVPTPAPHWGASRWQPPLGRVPAVVAETGPLAARAREVLDHGIWASGYRRRMDILGLSWPFAPGDLLGYEWSLRHVDAVHKIFVTQQRGRTEVVLELGAKATGTSLYLTSPAGALEKAWRWPAKGADKPAEIPLEEARRGFRAELDFWLTTVARGTGRWPFEATADSEKSNNRGEAEKPPVPGVEEGARPAAFLKLRRANDAERALFADAFGRIGADEERWAYTETSRGLDDKRVTVVRVDPSRPEGQRSVLLKVDGKPPTAAARQRWREEGRDVPAALGELPSLASLLDLAEVRVWAEEAAAVVFELPVRGGGGGFTAEKFQALFRVNKARRAFEDIAVKLREPVRVAGIARVADAGLAVRFQSVDPGFAPQPVWLQAGASARVLLVKFARGLEATRTDFQRVEARPEESR